jgi:hypothetical protein
MLNSVFVHLMCKSYQKKWKCSAENEIC